MRAIVITQPGGPEVLQIQEVADPVPAGGEVLIRVMAFGVNHAETHMRKGEWPEATPISGIEAVGTVATDPSGALAEGTKVLAIMGGLGRSRGQRGPGRDLARLGRPGGDPGELRHRVARAARQPGTEGWAVAAGPGRDLRARPGRSEHRQRSRRPRHRDYPARASHRAAAFPGRRGRRDRVRR